MVGQGRSMKVGIETIAKPVSRKTHEADIPHAAEEGVNMGRGVRALGHILVFILKCFLNKIAVRYSRA